jgi:5-(carboxyamino)imidazole ribonucleotide mutase
MAAKTTKQTPVLVGIVMGSKSDLATLQHAADMLKELAIPYEIAVVSAHRTPLKMVRYAQEAAGRGIQIIIAGAGGAAHLPGMIASLTILPVLGVPVQSRALSGMDSLLSIVQMPGGIPVGTLAIGEAGAKNAALLAAAILGLTSSAIQRRYELYRRQITRRTEQEQIDAATCSTGQPIA